MELNNKEKKIKQVLTDANFDIDTDFLWKEVSSELDKKKKRRFLWFIPLGLLGVFGLVYLFSNYSLSSTNAISNDSTSEQSLEYKKETSRDILNDSASKITNNKFEQSKKIIDDNSNIKSQKIITNNTEQVTSNSRRQSLNEIQATRRNTDPRLSSVINQQDAIRYSANQSNNFFATIENKVGSEKIIAESLTHKKSATKIDFNKVGTLPISFLQKNRAKKTIGNDKFESITVSNINSTRYYVGLAIGGIQNIATNNTIEGDFSQAYFDKELELPGVNTGLILGLQTKNDWRFFGGFDYTQLITRFVDSDSEFTESITQIDNQETINALGEYETTEGSLITTTLTSNDIVWHKRHQEFNFQLGASKNLLTNSKYRIAPEVSVIQNIYSSHSGYYFSELPPHLKKFTGREENPYRTNTGLKTQLGMNVGYQFKGLEFNINAAWRNPLTAITNQTNFYQIKNSQLSIQARVNYLLNWENN